MMLYPMHPHSREAVLLAIMLHKADPDLITKKLNKAKCPRKLFVIAAELEAQYNTDRERFSRFVNVTA